MIRMVNKALKTVKISLIVILLMLYSVQFYLAVQSTQTTHLPKIMGWGEVIFLSGSMSPAIETGDLALVHEQSAYKVGDIVTYIQNETLITHRIIEIQQDGTVILQGDANNTPDDPIYLDMIEGKTVLTIPYVGTVLQYMKTPYVMAGIAGIAVLIALWPAKEEEESNEDINDE